ncbi:hypothetical protein TNCV_4062491 [Trichonephila clavipes]|nr:hypothetical protein TNCV_4062491 [Trichonephila clavipes]
MRKKARRKLEKEGKVKKTITRNLRRNRRKRDMSVSHPQAKEIPLDTSGDSFDEDNNNNFCAVYKGYFYAKKGPKRDWIQCI